MSREAIPIMKAEAEVRNENPELEGEELANAINKKVEEIKKRSAEEKKQGYLRYRGNMFWAGITTQKQFNKKFREAIKDYKSGNFFLERIGRYREVDASLTMVLLYKRQQWIKQYEIKTIPEETLVDMALTSDFHFTRLNQAINNIMASIEYDFFASEVPRFKSTNFWGKKPYGKDDDRAIAEELAYRLTEVLLPTIEQYHRMYIRSLKAIRDLKRGNILLNIGNVGQVNIGDKQINVEK